MSALTWACSQAKAVQQMWEESEATEADYPRYMLADPILGYSADEHIGQFRFLANRRARKVKLKEPFPWAKERLEWLSEQASLRKDTAGREQRRYHQLFLNISP